ncbi:uncharacterized protein TNCV_823411 [Trichonephila clavipes]|nr:uncharacterized protein TNCV_823411 [Trichonephila clavipes]
MKSFPIAPAYGRTYGSRISSRYLTPVRVSLWNIYRSVYHRGSFLPKPGFHPLYNCVFNSVGLIVSGALLPPHQQTPCESLYSMNLASSVKSTEDHCFLVQETCSLAHNKKEILCRPLRGKHTTGRLA